MLFIDTHVAVFIHNGDPALLSPTGLHILDSAEAIVLSPMAALELGYLYESGKIRFRSEEITGFLSRELGISIETGGFGRAVLHAVSLTWTRDPFDRIITAQAALSGATLLTRDRTIRDNYAGAVW